MIPRLRRRFILQLAVAIALLMLLMPPWFEQGYINISHGVQGGTEVVSTKRFLSHDWRRPHPKAEVYWLILAFQFGTLGMLTYLLWRKGSN